ncbi:hypothetical protein [Streptomyces sp. NPDC056387]|uniref:hypothetical protein n=1 Tax=Streptomyces sp. NPDC056387 TaxID=3345803 RepID=UPI0035E321FE
MTSHFEYTDPDGVRLVVKPLPGVPCILLAVHPEDVVIPVDRLEEVIAGQRDMGRQAGGVPAFRRRLTELEHTAAWHAIEGTAGEDGADPGTVLAAVLRALGIDPPEPAAPPLTAIAGTHPPAGDRSCQCVGDFTCDPHLPAEE